MLGFDQWVDKYMVEFAEWFVLRYTEEVFYRENYTKDLLEEFKKKKDYERNRINKNEAMV